MNGNDTLKKFRALLPWLLLAIAVIGVFVVITEIGVFVGFAGRIWMILTPFFYGFLLAFVLNIPRDSIERLLAKCRVDYIVKRKKTFSILSVYILFTALLATVLNWVIPAVWDNIVTFVADLPRHLENLLQFIYRFDGQEFFGFYFSVDDVIYTLQDGVQLIIQEFGLDTLAAPLGTVIDVSAAVFGAVFVAIMTLISSIYILIEKEDAKAFLARALRGMTSPRVSTGIIKYADRLSKNVRKYFYTQTLDVIIIGVIATVVLFFIGSPYFLVLGIMLGLVNYIPYFGSIFGTIFAVIVVIFTQSFGMGVITAAILLFVQQMDANVIQPRLMSGRFSLSRLLVIISITVGGSFAGVFGMIIAIPILALLKDLVDSLLQYWERRRIEKDREQELRELELRELEIIESMDYPRRRPLSRHSRLYRQRKRLRD